MNVLEDLPRIYRMRKDFYDYEHACFTLDGQVLSVNKKMRPSLITYIQKTIKENQKHLERKLKWPLKLF